MATVSQAISNYIVDTISLSQADISQAVTSREWFLGRIKSEIEKQSNDPQLYVPDRFVYFGSYFKGTKVSAVDEFDVLVVLDSNTAVFYRDNLAYGQGLGSANPNHLFDSRFYKSDGSGISPTILLNWLKSIILGIAESFDGDAPERNGQAITATIKSYDLKIDLVPAVICKKSIDDSIFYVIPQGNSSNSWLVTQPRSDIDLLKAVANGKSNFRNIIRIAKRIKDTHNFLVSSFAIESAIVTYGADFTWYEDLYLDLKGVLSYLASTFRTGYFQDPFDPTTNLIEGVVSLSWYADRLDGMVQKLEDLNNSTYEQIELNEKVKKIFENE